jgi:hypothetical protein
MVRIADRLPRAVMAEPAFNRMRYAALTAVTIGLGLLVHMHGDGLPANVRDILGDMLWAAMIYWVLAFIAPGAPRAWLAAAAVGICFAVEFSQMLNNPALRAARSSLIGHLMLGSDYDTRDLFAYSAGVIAAALLDRRMMRRAKGQTAAAHH